MAKNKGSVKGSWLTLELLELANELLSDIGALGLRENFKSTILKELNKLRVFRHVVLIFDSEDLLLLVWLVTVLLMFRIDFVFSITNRPGIIDIVGFFHGKI
jgi:hypothetical protein